MIGILGTSLRTTCACQGTDPQHLYQCVGWRRLLWMNPCVGKLHTFFFEMRNATPSRPSFSGSAKRFPYETFSRIGIFNYHFDINDNKYNDHYNNHTATTTDA